jgi:hypothetical protein
LSIIQKRYWDFGPTLAALLVLQAVARDRFDFEIVVFLGRY